MVYIGTAGYSYKDWIGPFYPGAVRDTDMFPYYCTQFNFVEINSTYYHMPSKRLFESIDSRSGDDFKLSVKLFGGFTHSRDATCGEAEAFMKSLAPVIGSGKLLCLIAQYPFSFHCNEENTDSLKRLREWFDKAGKNHGCRPEINVEFRNAEWFTRKNLSFLAKEKLGLVCVDEPELKGLLPRIAAATSDVAYVRMHGRNAGKWYAGKGSERYDYLYPQQEIEEWVPKIRSLDMNARITAVSFNNHPIGKAVENARMMRELIARG